MKKRRVDVCWMQGVTCKGQGACFVGTPEKRYKLWWSGNNAESEGGGNLMKEKISENVKLEEKATE